MLELNKRTTIETASFTWTPDTDTVVSWPLWNDRGDRVARIESVTFKFMRENGEQWFTASSAGVIARNINKGGVTGARIFADVYSAEQVAKIPGLAEALGAARAQLEER